MEVVSLSFYPLYGSISINLCSCCQWRQLTSPSTTRRRREANRRADPLLLFFFPPLSFIYINIYSLFTASAAHDDSRCTQPKNAKVAPVFCLASLFPVFNNRPIDRPTEWVDGWVGRGLMLVECGQRFKCSLLLLLPRGSSVFSQ